MHKEGFAVADNISVLVVDDDADTVESIRMVLEHVGWEVRTASSAESGLAQLETFKPDVILLDVMMPDGTEGFQFVWSLRNESSSGLADVPIIILSAIHSTTPLRFYPQKTDGTYAPGEFLPVQGFIDKPADPAALVTKIKQVIGK
jgi:two-component system phosphate regulon response regulator PhoB